MLLTNATALPAKLLANPEVEGEYGMGTVLAKATFRFPSGGAVELETQTPLALFERDLETPLGLLPADTVARHGDRFEVMLLGRAHAPARGTTVLRVALSVGSERRELEVFGDRSWEPLGNGKQRAGAPLPFTDMPLVYERAFGGTFPLHLDHDSLLDVSDPINPRGLGFDAERWADALRQLLGAPPGYPALPGYQRRLPNLEHPKHLICEWADAPEPVGWAPLPRDTSIGQLPLLRHETERLAQQRGDPERARGDALGAEAAADPDQGLYRAHPDWIIDTPPAGARVRLENLLAEAPTLEFPLPPLRVIADYELYGRRGSRDLRPHALVLLPERRIFYLVYRLPFLFEKGPASGRSMRLRTASGWYPSEGG